MSSSGLRRVARNFPRVDFTNTIPPYAGYGLVENGLPAGLEPIFKARYADLGSISDTRGNGTPTFTRTTSASVTDQDGIIRYAKIGEVRFQGLRRVENLLTSPNEIFTSWTKINNGTGAVPIVSSGFTAPDGTPTAYRVQLSGGGLIGNYSSIRKAGIGTLTGLLVNSVWLKSNNGANQIISLNLGAGFGPLAPVTPVWQRFTTPLFSTASNFMDIGVGDGNLTDASADVLVWHPQQEFVSGQSVPVAGDYVSVGVQSAPVYHGAAVDGVKYFPTYNNNVVQQNDYTFSEDFTNASWTKVNASISADAIASPTGTLTADKLIEDGTNNFHRIQKGQASVLGRQYCASIYAKAGERRYLDVDITDSTTGGVFAYFDLVTGTISQAVTANGLWTNAAARITAIGNGWYRCEVTGKIGAGTTVSPVFILSNTPVGSEVPTYLGDGVSGLYLWGAQFQTGNRASTYVPTVAAAINNEIIEEAVGATIPAAIRKGFFAEGTRSNFLLSSSDFTSGGGIWANSNVTTTADQIVAPDGTLTADKVAVTAALATSLNQVIVGAGSTTGNVYSIYAKQGSGPTDANSFVLRDDTAGVNLVVYSIDYSTGLITYTTGTGPASAQNIGNGWWRLQVTGNAAVNGNNMRTYACFTGNVETAGEFAYIWGAQLEAGLFASSYLPTAALPTGRDIDGLPYDKIPSLVQSSGSAYAAAQMNGMTGAISQMIFRMGDNSGRPLWFTLQVGTEIASYDGTNVNSKSPVPDMTTAQRKVASSWGPAGQSVTSSGIAPTNSPFDGTMGPGNTSMNVGTNNFFGTIAEARIYASQLPDAVLQALTA